MKKLFVSASAFVCALLVFASSAFAGSFQDSATYKTRVGTASFYTDDSAGVAAFCRENNYDQIVYLQRLISGSWTTVGHNRINCTFSGTNNFTKTFQFEYGNRPLDGTYRFLFENTDPDRGYVSLSWTVGYY